MTWDQAFTAANAVALLSWIALIAAPRWPALIAMLRYGVIGLVALAYTVIVGLFFFRVEGGGYMTLAEVKRLFSSDAVIVAGWLHVIALDLFAGLWIAERLDGRGIGRLVQAPILVATFMFGPFGLLLAYLVGLIGRAPPRAPA
jgi:Domain of unknown function (DUF4281)